MIEKFDPKPVHHRNSFAILVHVMMSWWRNVIAEPVLGTRR